MNQLVRAWFKTPKGRELINRRRNLGHAPINERFEGCDEHHLRYSKSNKSQDNNLTLYVPRKLHQSIAHNGNTGKNMRKVNMLLLEWYFENTSAENRNPKAVKLYLNYCMLPEPQWSPEICEI
jgi:hypothetical protein